MDVRLVASEGKFLQTIFFFVLVQVKACPSVRPSVHWWIKGLLADSHPGVNNPQAEVEQLTRTDHRALNTLLRAGRKVTWCNFHCNAAKVDD